MAIARVTDTDKVSNGGSGTTLTFSVTVSGSDTILFVGGHTINSPAGDLTATYNSVSLTEIAQVDFNGDNRTYLWALAAPSDGTHDVVITTTNSGDNVNGTSAVYSGASQTLPAGTAIKTAFETSAAASVDPYVLNPVSIADDSWAYSFPRNIDRSWINDTNFVQLAAPASFTHGDSNGGMGTAGTETVSYDASAKSRLVIAVAAFAPVAEAAGGTNFFAVL